MTHLDADDFADIVVNAIKVALAPIVARLKAAEDMVTDLRSELRTKAVVQGVQWAGVHKANTPYDAGQLVTHGGSLWLAKRTNLETPGHAPDCWVLIVKKGDFGVRNERVQ